MKLAIIHRGSQTARQIIEGVGIKRWGRRVQADVIVNYGLAGSRFEDWKGRNPVGKLKRMINRPHGLNKYEVVMKAEDWGVRVPETRTSLDLRHNGEGWLEKPFYSQAGRGIEEIISGFTRLNPPLGKYFQQYLHERIYELRVHTFRWMPSNEWSVQKRVGDVDEVTWNYHTGGTFITVNDTSQRVFADAIEMSHDVLRLMNMGFGAVDFIVDQDRKVYFIEINSAPGAQELSLPIYVEAFQRLKEMDVEEVGGFVS